VIIAEIADITSAKFVNRLHDFFLVWYVRSARAWNVALPIRRARANRSRPAITRARQTHKLPVWSASLHSAFTNHSKHS
jgi:hypothetical protein